MILHADWAPTGIATGLLVDLALHVRYTAPTNDYRMAQVEAETRDMLLLGAFVYATLWSLYLGRPNAIPNPVLSAVKRVVGDGSCNNTMHMWVALCMQMLDIIEILNSSPTRLQADRTANFRLCSLEINLRSVFDGLPQELAFDDARIDELDAEAYGPHMQYFGIQVTLHRAMIKAGQSSETGEDDIQPKSLDHLYSVVHQDAIRIAKLVLSYRRIFGLENIITVMLDNIYVAAMALVSHVVRVQQISQPYENEVRWLRLLNEVLEAVEKHYPITARMRTCLIHFISQTSLAGLFQDRMPIASPNSVPESMTGIPVTASASVKAPMPAAVNPAPLDDRNDFSSLDFTLTTEDDWWLHDSAWNMAPLPGTL